jgi:hypothetical protein
MTDYKSDVISVQQLVEQGIVALKAGDKSKAFATLTQALALDPQNEQAWIWLSGVCARDAERKFCMERVIEINHNSEVALSGLNKLPADIRSESPLPKRPLKSSNPKCAYPGCEIKVSKPDHKYCQEHWKAKNSRVVSESKEEYGVVALLSATAIGEKIDLSVRKVNLILSELGWITREKKGWVPTSQGIALGAVQKIYSQTGIPFVYWPKSIIENKVFLSTIADFNGEQTLSTSTNQDDIADFRNKFPPKHRATDGHWVRSKAELLIDNWLYVSGIAHAYERRLPIEEEAYCDFYIPEGKVYLEYWGLERDPKYEARMKVKIELYEKYGLNLLELTDDHIRNLDDYLPTKLLEFNLIVS